MLDSSVSSLLVMHDAPGPICLCDMFFLRSVPHQIRRHDEGTANSRKGNVPSLFGVSIGRRLGAAIRTVCCLLNTMLFAVNREGISAIFAMLCFESGVRCSLYANIAISELHSGLNPNDCRPVIRRPCAVRTRLASMFSEEEAGVVASSWEYAMTSRSTCGGRHASSSRPYICPPLSKPAITASLFVPSSLTTTQQRTRIPCNRTTTS